MIFLNFVFFNDICVMNAGQKEKTLLYTNPTT